MVTVPRRGLTVDPRGNSTTIGLRRFGDTFTDLAPSGGKAFVVRIPSDAQPTPWHARVSLHAPARVCAPPA